LSRLDQIDGVKLITKNPLVDKRGYFREWFSTSSLTQLTGKETTFKQGNFSLSKKGTIRGIHFSTSGEGQAKLVTCLTGKIWDVVVDLRKNSSSYGQWIANELTPENGRSIFIPSGLGHGFQALEEDSTIAYLLSSEYDPSSEASIHPFDKSLDIDWPLPVTFISERDKTAPPLQAFQN